MKIGGSRVNSSDFPVGTDARVWYRGGGVSFRWRGVSLSSGPRLWTVCDRRNRGLSVLWRKISCVLRSLSKIGAGTRPDLLVTVFGISSPDRDRLPHNFFFVSICLLLSYRQKPQKLHNSGHGT